MRNDKLKSTIGLCAKAGALAIGTPSVCDYLRTLREDKRAATLVLEASDTSPGTHKKLADKCSFYGVKLVRLSLDGEELAATVGKSGVIATACVKNASLVKAVEKSLLNLEKENSEH